MYSAHSEISRQAAVPAHLFGTRQAIFLLMRQEPGPDEALFRAPPPPAPAVLDHLLSEDRFDF